MQSCEQTTTKKEKNKFIQAWGEGEKSMHRKNKRKNAMYISLSSFLFHNPPLADYYFWRGMTKNILTYTDHNP
eukprot:NODE_8172_length_421_cov_43.250000_g7305_i0.p2 GENE.NODE_8172_length_421_cov_43.250000_g7305_i0~~NODE_8172_length_421_cov_43.250000_g7305_i0.p2  ORF type:complete len:73 (-),score=0.05 NODE_8172_length_421_cov_43.250000_g7305_i0:99-317(-)